ncbi:MAG: hypothetical protein NVS4B5_05960 [Vulcanimicrobiaceae bacterium]
MALADATGGDPAPLREAAEVALDALREPALAEPIVARLHAAAAARWQSGETSRAPEHAAWSLADRGFRAVVAPSFARIFYENAYNNGIAPVIVDATEIDALLGSIFASIDLDREVLTRDDGGEVRFTLDPLRKQFLFSGGYMAFLNGKIDAVRRWEAARTT